MLKVMPGAKVDMPLATVFRKVPLETLMKAEPRPPANTNAESFCTWNSPLLEKVAPLMQLMAPASVHVVVAALRSERSETVWWPRR